MIFLKKFNKWLVFFIITILIAGCGVVMKTVGSLAGNLLTGTTNDLNEAAIQVFFMRNAYPKAAGTVETDFFGDDYRDGGNMAFVSFMKKHGAGMLKIDGQVIIGGVPVEHLQNGFYGRWVDGDAPVKIEINTSTGQHAEFTVTPPPPIKLLAVNGRAENPEINLNEDFNLKMQTANTNANTEFKVGLLTEVMGLNVFQDVGIFKYRDNITIPHEVFSNPMYSSAPTLGPNYVLITRFNVTPTNVKGVGAAQIIGASQDYMPVTVTGELDETWYGSVSNGMGIRYNDKIESKNGTFNVDFSKPNAFLGRPFSSGKKFAMVSFSVRATRLQQEQTSSTSSTAGNVTTTVTTTETRTFPKLPDFFWEKLVNDLYADFEGVLRKNFNFEMIPIEDVLRAKSYKDLTPISDKVSVTEVEKSYKGTKNLIPTSLSAMLDNVSSTFASDRIDSRLIRELGVDGIIACTIDLQMTWEGALQPAMSVRISGGPNGFAVGPTIYLQGTINGNGTKLEDANITADNMMKLLPTVIRKDELMSAFEKSINKIAEYEKTAAYEKIWSLK